LDIQLRHEKRLAISCSKSGWQAWQCHKLGRRPCHCENPRRRYSLRSEARAHKGPANNYWIRFLAATSSPMMIVMDRSAACAPNL
jgi:hypothetical protein